MSHHTCILIPPLSPFHLSLLPSHHLTQIPLFITYDFLHFSHVKWCNRERCASIHAIMDNFSLKLVYIAISLAQLLIRFANDLQLTKPASLNDVREKKLRFELIVQLLICYDTLIFIDTWSSNNKTRVMNTQSDVPAHVQKSTKTIKNVKRLPAWLAFMSNLQRCRNLLQSHRKRLSTMHKWKYRVRKNRQLNKDS